MNNTAKFLNMPMQRYLASSKASATSITETYGILPGDLAAIVRHDYPLAGKLLNPIYQSYEIIKIQNYNHISARKTVRKK